jgi:hypothetical protein
MTIVWNGLRKSQNDRTIEPKRQFHFGEEMEDFLRNTQQLNPSAAEFFSSKVRKHHHPPPFAVSNHLEVIQVGFSCRNR